MKKPCEKTGKGENEGENQRKGEKEDGWTRQ